jgi:hypothetical protein
MIRRMNKKLNSLIGQKAEEKVGKDWALTTFLRYVGRPKRSLISFECFIYAGNIISMRASV